MNRIWRCSDIVTDMLYSHLVLTAFLATFLSLLTSTTAKIDRNAPQGHTGMLKPYQPGPFGNLVLSASDLATLQRGQPVLKQQQSGTSGGAICVQDVKAPVAAVWNQILNFPAYKGKVPKVLHSSNYAVENKGSSKSRIRTKLVLSVLPGYSVSFFCKVLVNFSRLGLE